VKDADVEKLRELMQIEQFREGLDPDLAIWLIDQKPTTVTDAVPIAQVS
jgi:hypothetical protein